MQKLLQISIQSIVSFFNVSRSRHQWRLQFPKSVINQLKSFLNNFQKWLFFIINHCTPSSTLVYNHHQHSFYSIINHSNKIVIIFNDFSKKNQFVLNSTLFPPKSRQNNRLCSQDSKLKEQSLTLQTVSATRFIHFHNGEKKCNMNRFCSLRRESQWTWFVVFPMCQRAA